MKIYLRTENGEQLKNKNGVPEFFELVPCNDCAKYVWDAPERTQVEKSILLISKLEEFDSCLYHAVNQCCSPWDKHHEIEYSKMLDSLQAPLERKSSSDLEILMGILQLAAFAGVSDIDLPTVIAAYKKLHALAIHIRSKHLTEAVVEIFSPLNLFLIKYPDWIGLENLLAYLPLLRNKSVSQVMQFLKSEWKALPRCEKCNGILSNKYLQDSAHICQEMSVDEREELAACAIQGRDFIW